MQCFSREVGVAGREWTPAAGATGATAAPTARFTRPHPSIQPLPRRKCLTTLGAHRRSRQTRRLSSQTGSTQPRHRLRLQLNGSSGGGMSAAPQPPETTRPRRVDPHCLMNCTTTAAHHVTTSRNRLSGAGGRPRRRHRSTWAAGKLGAPSCGRSQREGERESRGSVWSL